ncbi:hypothetical protein, partial [Streptomyces sp. SID5770]|uniref:hypothetical protein n=1 Tax=Streptomyces sp. SID5770 TaxID=2690308 RepID=UPI001F42E895
SRKTSRPAHTRRGSRCPGQAVPLDVQAMGDAVQQPVHLARDTAQEQQGAVGAGGILCGNQNVQAGAVAETDPREVNSDLPVRADSVKKDPADMGRGSDIQLTSDPDNRLPPTLSSPGHMHNSSCAFQGETSDAVAGRCRLHGRKISRKGHGSAGCAPGAAAEAAGH